MAGLERIASLALQGRLSQARKALGDGADPEARLWRAYLHNATGEFDDALAVAMEVAEASGDASLASRALVTAASALRQTHRHLPAHPMDESALRLAPDDATAAHALIGLAADCVGLGRAEEAEGHIDAAVRRAPGGDWRIRVRLAWVRCEHALLTARARKAATHARDALERSRAAGARRHEAKSLLFLGVALREAGDPAWTDAVRKSREIAGRIGAAPVRDAAAALLEGPAPARRLPGA